MGLVRHELGLSSSDAALSAEGHLPGDLFARRQHLRAAGRGAGGGLPLVRRMGGRTQAAVRRLRRGQAAAAGARLRRPAALLGRRWSPSRRWRAAGRRRASTTCWSTNTRTPTCCRPAILRAMKPDGRGLTVVGDDAQSIYSFRGADGAQHPRLPGSSSASRRGSSRWSATTARPSRSSTSPTRVIAARRRAPRQDPLDRQALGRAGRSWCWCPTRRSRRCWVADRVLAHREGGLALKSQAVLFRTSSHSAALELELARRNIPFVKYGGLKFLEAAHVKDVLAVLRFAAEPARPDGRLSRRAADPGHRPGERGAAARRDGRGRRSGRRGAGLRAAGRGAGRVGSASPPLYAALRAPELPWPADMELALALVSAAPGAAARRCRRAARRRRAAGAAGRRLRARASAS